MTKEEHLQVAVADYLRLQYPKALFTHIANERQTSPIVGSKLKRMGVRKGMPDIMIFECRIIKQAPLQSLVEYCGLAIELKVKPNKPTAAQLEILEHLSARCWLTTVCYSFDEAKIFIDNYFKVNHA